MCLLFDIIGVAGLRNVPEDVSACAVGEYRPRVSRVIQRLHGLNNFYWFKWVFKLISNEGSMERIGN